MTDIMPLTDIKILCNLVQSYCKGEINKETFWACRDSNFNQLPLFEERMQ